MKARWWIGALAVVVAAVAGSAQVVLPYFEDFEDPTPEALPATGMSGIPPQEVAAAWNVAAVLNPVIVGAFVWEQGLWKTVDKDDFSAESPVVREFPSGSQALYYGNVNVEGRGTYDTGQATIGAVSTPVLAATPGTTYQVQFKMLRIVESFQGSFDRTRVFVVFRDGFGNYLASTGGVVGPVGLAANQHAARLQIFARDSSNPSSTGWEQVLSQSFTPPAGTVGMEIIFEFDSRDAKNNNFLGWLVDDVWVGQPPQITTAALPNGTERVPYDFTLAATPAPGGVNPRLVWELERGYDVLPPGLEFDPAAGRIHGTPTQAGTWTIGFILKDESGGQDRKRLDLTILPAIGAGPVRLATDWNAALGTWTTTGLWHRTHIVVPASVGADIVVPPPPPPVGVANQAAYYGLSPLNTVAPVTYNYVFPKAPAQPARTSGFLTSPAIPLVAADAGKYVGVRFAHWREVEFFEKGAFDQTYVEISFDNRNWTRIWYKDSRDPSERTWQTVVAISTVTIPAGTTRMWVRFGFDSVDATNNAFAGWVIDNVEVRIVEPALSITTACPLPAGVKGMAYSVTLRAFGGTPPYRWEVAGLPAGLSVNPLTGVISGTPTQDGEFYLTITVTDATLATAEKTRCLLSIAASQALFQENFDTCPFAGPKWETPTGLWQCTNTVIYNGQDLLPAMPPVGGPPVAESAAYYGRAEVVGTTYGGQPPVVRYNYNTGNTTKGELTSKAFPLSGAKYVTVSFWYWREVESYAGQYDRTYLQVKFGSGSWCTIWYADSSVVSEKTWLNWLGSFEVPTGATTMQIRFVFDSVDRHNNGFVGWLVDNILVTAADSGVPLPCLAMGPASLDRDGTGISFFNYPNPVRDVHTTTFAVRGVEAEAIRVEVYDLSGRLVYTAEVAGSELVWHTQDQLGRYLANGVYLYRVHAKVAGTWISSELQKVAIFR